MHVLKTTSKSFINADYLRGEQISQDKLHIAAIKKNTYQIFWKQGNLIQDSF